MQLVFRCMLKSGRGVSVYFCSGHRLFLPILRHTPELRRTSGHIPAAYHSPIHMADKSSVEKQASDKAEEEETSFPAELQTAWYDRSSSFFSFFSVYMLR